MAVLSDYIEQFLKRLLEEGSVELQRNELAQQFGCAPSQISYVLATRFTVEQGYVIDSRRGGGGYVRIAKVSEDGGYLLEVLTQRIGRELEFREAMLLVARLEESGQVTKREAALLRAAAGKGISSVNAAAVRAAIFRSMLLSLLRLEDDVDSDET